MAAEHRRRGHAHALRPRCQHSHRQLRRARGACRQQSQLRRLGAERALHDRSAAQRSIGWRIDQAPVPVGHFQHRRSHSMAFVRHHAEPASPGEWWWDHLDHVVRRDRNDTTWSTIVGTWRPGRLELYVDGWSRASSTSRGHQHQRLVRHLPLGLGLLHLAGLQRRHRARRVLRLILHPRHGAALARRSVRLPAPMGRGACAHGECAARHAPLDPYRLPLPPVMRRLRRRHAPRPGL